MNREKLLDAMREAASAEFAAVPAEEDIAWTPSDRFRQRMELLIRQERRYLWRPTGRRLVLVAALMTLLLAMLVTAGAFREPDCRIFTEERNGYLVVAYGESKPGDTQVFYGLQEAYTLSWLPEGYEETSFSAPEDSEWTFFETVWTNGDGDTLTLYQGPVSGRRYLNADRKYETVSLGGGDALIDRGRDYGRPFAPPYTTVYWASGQYAYTLYAQSELPTETIAALLHSLEKRGD